MANPKTKKDPTEEQDPKPQPPTDPAGDPPAADPAPAPTTDPAKDPADPEDPPAADPKDPPAAEPDDPKDPPAADPQTDPQSESDEVAALKLQLLESNARVAAYKSGVKPAAVEDAVVLAMHAVNTAGGELSEEAIQQAITAVLERHPEWNAASTPVAPVKAGAEPPADPNTPKTNAILHGKVVL